MTGVRVAVIGGGVIGLSIAWRAAAAGYRVELFDPSDGTAAARVAGGMLAPLSEARPGEQDALAFGAASLERWPGFIADLGTDPTSARGALTVALDGADLADRHKAAAWVAGFGHDIRPLSRREVRDLEPTLGPSIRGGVFAPAEGSVDNRRLLEALRAAGTAAGVVHNRTAVSDTSTLPHDRVIVAAGWRSAALLPERFASMLYPAKGEILRVRTRPGSAAGPGHVIRAAVHGRPAYLVPRADGYVVGATQYEHGDDLAVTVAGVRDLLQDAELVFPAIGDYELFEAAAGLRPMSRDDLPLIGTLDEDGNTGTIVACGHGRNGILLAPLTADAVLAALDGRVLAEAAAALPERVT